MVYMMTRLMHIYDAHDIQQKNTVMCDSSGTVLIPDRQSQ